MVCLFANSFTECQVEIVVPKGCLEARFNSSRNEIGFAERRTRPMRLLQESSRRLETSKLSI
jgi:hypothetical protein